MGDGTTTDSTTPLQVSGLSGVAAIAVGEDYSPALKADGTVWAWGYNGYGQLGDGTTAHSNTPCTGKWIERRYCHRWWRESHDRPEVRRNGLGVGDRISMVDWETEQLHG